MGVKYKVGNLGDLIKHTWLIETLEYLKMLHPDRPISYADSFCGFNEYEIESPYADRLSKQFSRFKLYEYQKTHLESNKYAGSVTLAIKILGIEARIDIFDTNQKALENSANQDVNLVSLKSGYDILDNDIPYDLIFLDPYDNFFNEYKSIVQRIAEKLPYSSILLFVPSKRKIDMQKLFQTIDQSDVPFINGTVGNPENELDSTHNFGVLFFPSDHLSDKDFETLAKLLIRETEKIKEVINNPGS